MVRLQNVGINQILCRQEKIIIYGASQHLENMLRHFNNRELLKRIEFIVDKDERKDGGIYSAWGREFPVISLNRLLQIERISMKYQMIIVIEKYVEVIKELDIIERLDGLLCYAWWMVHSQRTAAEKIQLPKVQHKYNIPKIIHYCWFGRSKLPENVQQSINSWRKTNPEFEILEWNESNYEIPNVDFIKEAYEQRKYSFVSDYVRYDVISKYGGFYFDTDVELLGDISDLCVYRGFMTFEHSQLINSGSGFAAQKDDEIIMELKSRYHNRKFITSKNRLNLKPCSEYETEYFKEKGIQINDCLQVYQDFLILPHEFFAPVNQITAALELTPNTRGIHKFECTWFEENEKNVWDEKKKEVLTMNQRLLIEWKGQRLL